MGRPMNEGKLSRGVAEAARPAQDDEGAAPGRLTRRAALGFAGALIGAAMAPGLARAYAPTLAPRITHVVISKKNRVLELRIGKATFRRYRVDLGFKPEGHKFSSGDGRTPEGRYWIDRRNARSDFYLSLGISYPNATDMARAQALGVDPGGNIFIHGEPMRRARMSSRDWTAGCIAVRNDEIEEIWALTPLGVPVTILA